MPSPTNKISVMKGEVYKLMDSFLVEAKDQNGKERTLERLNFDRHLFVENMMDLFDSLISTLEAEVEKVFKQADDREDRVEVSDVLAIINKAKE